MLGALGAVGGPKPAKPTFISYVAPEEISRNDKEPAEKSTDIFLLPGEQLLCEANTVLKCTQDESSQRGIVGRLICTNFKVAFLTDDPKAKENEPEFRNKVVGENDITLQCVDQIYGVYDEKKKSLLSGHIKKYPEKLILYCKDFRVFHFCLKFTKEEEVKRIVSGIIHHIQSPKRLKRLFLFSYAAVAPNYIGISTKCQTTMFDTIKDWRLELERVKAYMKYKVASTNECYEICENLPQYFVVPVALPDGCIVEFKGKGIPLWCWSCPNGCALMKMSPLPKEQDEGILQQQKEFLDGIEKIIHRPPYEVTIYEDLSVNLPSLPEIQAAYNRFKQLFYIDNRTEYWDSDVKWFSALESCNWLEVIRQCLKKAIEVSQYLEVENTNVVLKENTSDLCCVISSLVQVMMDPYCRTKLGFQSLIQKEWVIGGHCFLDRCNHLRQNDKDEVPVFLLFLDCVWQLVQQYPIAFEFTETYLTVLSDSVYIPIFSTFFFNSPFQKDTHHLAGESQDIQSKSLSFHSVWNWSVQFDAKAQALFHNPLYVSKTKPSTRNSTHQKHQRQLSLPLTQSKSTLKKVFFKEETGPFIKNLLGKRISKLISSPDEAPDSSRWFYDSWHCKPLDLHGLILPHIEGPEIRVWAQRCLRWIPEAQILGGGTVSTMSKIFEMMDELQILQTKVEEKCSVYRSDSRRSDMVVKMRNAIRASSLYPFALLHRTSFKPKPVIPTSTWKGLEAEDDLAKRDDESFDLGSL
ncbi:myotubularin-related protein 12 isoform X2 [Pleurodeles waltl]|uniref:myotubularin-related protein 12 isoform X2 n=1 Tax=Pleurodeles waltl TaxID=8319 RepID=UPI003709458E